MDHNDKPSVQPTPKKLGSANHLDDIFNDFVANGGMENVKGAGKPLHVPDGDVLNSVLKTANYLPPWLELQKQIRANMKHLIEQLDNDAADVSKDDWAAQFDELNEQIKKYNRSVPSPLLQKGFVSANNISSKYEQWE
ncbi:DUF1992 domain-containing protein [Paenibacillus campi]|uniref:DnaJ family domain-containing protein n=1 Tax=Paenibacillus campi TaxID=3106031 RepID=UPI002B001AD4|nr:DUF1992 domain-containing protein [Paenibacillus sp. SGZ-1014]